MHTLDFTVLPSSNFSLKNSPNGCLKIQIHVLQTVQWGFYLIYFFRRWGEAKTKVFETPHCAYIRFYYTSSNFSQLLATLLLHLGQVAFFTENTAGEYVCISPDMCNCTFILMFLNLGPFNNYVDHILPNFDHLPPRVDNCGHFTYYTYPLFAWPINTCLFLST